MAHQEGEPGLFGITISAGKHTATTALNERADMRIVKPRVAA